jgi:serine/threonine protein kinase
LEQVCFLVNFQGAYGVVVKALDKQEKKFVAIKKIFKTFEHGKEYQKRILRELKVMRHFTGHENV